MQIPLHLTIPTGHTLHIPLPPRSPSLLSVHLSSNHLQHANSFIPHKPHWPHFAYPTPSQEPLSPLPPSFSQSPPTCKFLYTSQSPLATLCIFHSLPGAPPSSRPSFSQSPPTCKFLYTSQSPLATLCISHSLPGAPLSSPSLLQPITSNMHIPLHLTIPTGHTLHIPLPPRSPSLLSVHLSANHLQHANSSIPHNPHWPHFAYPTPSQEPLPPLRPSFSHSPPTCTFLYISQSPLATLCISHSLPGAPPSSPSFLQPITSNMQIPLYLTIPTGHTLHIPLPPRSPSLLSLPPSANHLQHANSSISHNPHWPHFAYPTPSQEPLPPQPTTSHMQIPPYPKRDFLRVELGPKEPGLPLGVGWGSGMGAQGLSWRSHRNILIVFRAHPAEL
nr:PREDICTED: leucine-rich repeat extensin-like protein 5 [Anolis carolinensis]|eukprot:XP_016846260.1 PREDICTED: leucine-rich repeat extensin-like protein 5 [Anolis carolinensis]